MDFNLLPYSSTPTMSVPIKGPRLKLVEYRSLIYLQMQKLFISLDLSFISVSTSNLEFPGASLIAILGASTDSSNTPWEFLQSPSLLKWTSIVLPRSTSYSNCYFCLFLFMTPQFSVSPSWIHVVVTECICLHVPYPGTSIKFLTFHFSSPPTFTFLAPNWTSHSPLVA